MLLLYDLHLVKKKIGWTKGHNLIDNSWKWQEEQPEEHTVFPSHVTEIPVKLEPIIERKLFFSEGNVIFYQNVSKANIHAPSHNSQENKLFSNINVKTVSKMLAKKIK